MTTKVHGRYSSGRYFVISTEYECREIEDTSLPDNEVLGHTHPPRQEDIVCFSDEEIVGAPAAWARYSDVAAGDGDVSYCERFCEDGFVIHGQDVDDDAQTGRMTFDGSMRFIASRVVHDPSDFKVMPPWVQLPASFHELFWGIGDYNDN